MTTANERDSLASRLSRRLAVQGFAGLALLSLANLSMTAVHLRERQTQTLDGLETLVRHRLGEGVDAGDLAVNHDLEDLFAHRIDTALELDVDGTMSLHAAPEFDVADDTVVRRRRAVDLAQTGATMHGAVSATLLLDTREDRSLLTHLALTQLATSLIGALLAALVAAWHVKQGLAPLRQLGQDLADFRLTAIGRPIDASGQPAELRPVVGRFNDVLARLDDAWRQMRAFNANVAHELKTPLATIASISELLLSDESLSARARDLIGSNLEEVQHLDRIVRAMLFLASAERGAAAQACERVSIAELVRDTFDYHDAVLDEAGLHALVEGDAIAVLDPMLVRQAVSNLVGNATRYAEPGSTIDVSITSKEVGIDERNSTVEIAVTNRGPEIPAHDLERLFDRFYRVESDTVAGCADDPPSGHGLGLAIVAAIARMHNGRAFAVSTNRTTRIGFTIATETGRSSDAVSETPASDMIGL